MPAAGWRASPRTAGPQLSGIGRDAARRDAEEERRQRSCEPERGHEPNDDTGHGQAKTRTNDVAENRRPRRAKSLADRRFLTALAHLIGKDAVDTDDRESQRDRREHSRVLHSHESASSTRLTARLTRRHASRWASSRFLPAGVNR